MTFNDEKYSISFEGNIFTFSGKMEKAEYPGLANLLKESGKISDDDTIIFDFKALKFINSTGIKTLASFFLQSVKKVVIKINKDITWQKATIVPLSQIRPDNAISVIE